MTPRAPPPPPAPIASAPPLVEAIATACSAAPTDDRMCEMNQHTWARMAAAKLPLTLK